MNLQTKPGDVHASGLVSVIAGEATLEGATQFNLADVVRNGPGDYVVEMGDTLSVTNRAVHVSIIDGVAGIVIADETLLLPDQDTHVAVLGFAPGGAPADVSFTITVVRTGVGSG